MNPKLVVICGSTRFIEEIAVCAWLIERDEHAIVMGPHLLPWWYGVADHVADVEEVYEDIYKLHLQKIDLSDEIFVVNKDNYIGNSTSNEVQYATSKGKKIRWYQCDPVGEKVNAMIK